MTGTQHGERINHATEQAETETEDATTKKGEVPVLAGRASGRVSEPVTRPCHCHACNLCAIWCTAHGLPGPPMPTPVAAGEPTEPPRVTRGLFDTEGDA